MSKKLYEHSPEEQATLSYAALCELRREAYADHMDLYVTDKLDKWVAAMTAKYKSPEVRVWAHVVDWPTALMIVRWGEEPKHWPEEFTEEDVARAGRWLAGTDLPQGVVYGPFDEETA